MFALLLARGGRRRGHGAPAPVPESAVGRRRPARRLRRAAARSCHHGAGERDHRRPHHAGLRAPPPGPLDGRGAPRLDAARAVLRPVLRRRGGAGVQQPPPRAGRGRPAPSARGLPDRLLRDLVGVDELHVVLLGLRQRRRPVPDRRVRADRRRADPGRRRAAGVLGRELRHRHARVRRDARRARLPLAAGGAGRPATPPDRHPLRRRHQRLHGRLGPPAAAPGRDPASRASS